MLKAQKNYDDLCKQLSAYEAKSDSFSNPIQLLALEISKRLQQGKISTKELGELVHLLCTKGFALRAKRLKAYIGELDFNKNALELKKFIEQMASNMSFAQFSSQIETAGFGIVITAHPTFCIAEDIANALTQVVTANDNPSCDMSRFLHKPDEHITLAYEHKVSMQAIVNLQDAISKIYNIVFVVAAKHYPQQWHKLTPSLMTIASWVGYDLDGRIDITWSDTLLVRMESAILQLERYMAKLAQILPNNSISVKLAARRDQLNKEMALLTEYIQNKANIDALVKLKTSNDNSPELTDLTTIVKQLNTISKAIKDPNILQELFVLRSEMQNYSLGVAHIHVRVNAIQFHNAIHNKIKIEAMPEDSAEQQYYVGALNKLLKQVKPCTTNFGTILQEQKSVKRLFMLLAYIFKYIDVKPIRFLIAEVENVCSVLTALYYAKLFGIEDKIDISPLFETEYGLHHGADIIEALILNPHYRKYIELRGQLCIQTGFSDAGRYVGQLTATLALERLRMKIGRLFKQYNLSGIQLVIFDTHGESIGRGSNPKDIYSRINYVASPTSRNLFKELNIKFKHETSFQGGDGYLYFKNQDLAFATVSRLLYNNFAYASEKNIAADPFYTNINYAFSFFFAIKKFHSQLFHDPDYAVLLNVFRNNMLYPTGSRANKRQHEDTAGVDHAHPSQMRAIPHNTILQQLGVLVNTVSGLGEIIQKDPEQFVEMYKKSERFRSLMTMVTAADQLSNFAVLDAYIELLNPGYWLQKAENEKELPLQKSMLKLAALLETDKRFEALKRVVRKLKDDKIKFYSIFENIPQQLKDELFSADYRKQLDLLHAVRIALMQSMFLTTTHLPKFATSPGDIKVDEITQMILRLEILPALDILYSIFPINTETLNNELFGKTTYSFDENKGYVDEHKQLFEPMQVMYDLIRQISTGISYLSGAVG